MRRLLVSSPFYTMRYQMSTCGCNGLITHLQGRESMHMDVRSASFGSFKQPQVCLSCTSINGQKPHGHYMNVSTMLNTTQS